MNDKQLSRLANDPIASLKYGSALKVRFLHIEFKNRKDELALTIWEKIMT